MTALFISLITDPTVLAIIGGVLAVFGIGFQQRRAGAAKERAKQERKEQRARDVNDEIEDAIAGRTYDENRERLGRWGK